MTAIRILSLRGDVTRGKVRDNNDRALDENDLWFFRADRQVLRFTLLETADEGETWTAFVVSPTATLKFGIKDPAAITGATFLAFADHAAFNDPTDWAQVSLANGKICCRLSTNTAALETFLSSSGATPRTAIAELQIQEPGEDPFTALQFSVGARNDVIRGDEGDPAPGSPTYPTADELAAKVGSGVQIARVGSRVELRVDGIVLATWDVPA